MSADTETESFLRRQLDSVFANDVADCHATRAEDLTLYKWSFKAVAPHWLRAHDPADAGQRAIRIGWGDHAEIFPDKQLRISGRTSP